MPKTYVLFATAGGYSLFQVHEFEEIGQNLPQLRSAVEDLSRFNSVVKLVSFFPFKNAVSALENINAISECIVSDDLQHFLDLNLPKESKKVTLGVHEPRLGSAISEALKVKCTHIGAMPVIIRGIRLHFSKLVKGFSEKSSAVAMLGLGHSYSRAKLKFNVHRVDNMVIQSIALLDQLDKNINTFAMKVREWYSCHFPELYKIVPENYTYCVLASFIKDRKTLTDEALPQLEEICMDAGKAQAIIDASKCSMGMDINELDLMNIQLFAKKVAGISEYRKTIAGYLTKKMGDIAPNLAALVGEQVGARLISHAGSLTNLAKAPASTVQILGAEKALFRALKTRGNTPKYGLLFHSTFIGRAAAKNKGRISRYLANKCSIASRVDCFADDNFPVFGIKMKQQVEDRLKFFDSGDIPKKNIDVMKEAIEEVEAHAKIEKKKKKAKKRKASEMEPSEENGNGADNGIEAEITPQPKKKKKKKNKSITE